MNECALFWGYSIVISIRKLENEKRRIKSVNNISGVWLDWKGLSVLIERVEFMIKCLIKFFLQDYSRTLNDLYILPNECSKHHSMNRISWQLLRALTHTTIKQKITYSSPTHNPLLGGS
jgi:hypothetical protein